MAPGAPQASLIVFRNPGSFRTSTRETCVQRAAERRAAFLSGHAGRGSPVPRCPCLPAPSEPRLPMVGDVGRVRSRVGFRAWGLFLTPRYLLAPKEEPPCLPRLAGHAPRHRAGRACSSTSVSFQSPSELPPPLHPTSMHSITGHSSWCPRGAPPRLISLRALGI